MGGQNGIVVPNNDNEDHNQQLIQGQDNSDVSLSVNTPAMIQTYTIRNPIYLKKETLSLEKDAENNNIYYIKFNYDSLVDFDLYINFNVQLNKQGKKTLLPNTNENQHLLSYVPSQNFQSKGITFKNLPKGENIPFFEPQAFIDINYFDNNKISNPETLSNNGDNNSENKENINKKDLYYDICIEMFPIFDENSQENKDKNEISLITLCKIVIEENETHHHIIRCELQRLKTYNIYINMFDIFNCALDSGECLICCTELRNTVFLPCKHSCTCNTCAHSLRMRNSTCPICKKPIDELLIIDVEEDKENNVRIDVNNNLINNEEQNINNYIMNNSEINNENEIMNT